MNFASLTLLLLGSLVYSDVRAQEPDSNLDPLYELPGGVELIQDIVYATPGGRELHLDLFQPRPSGNNRPAVMLIHGGGWRQGDKTQYWRQAANLAERGFVTVSIEYRLAAEALFPAALQDAKAAVRWLRTNAETYRIDPSRIGALGGSAGGHLAAMLGVTEGVTEFEGDGGNPGVSSRIHAVAALYPFLDLVEEGKRRGPDDETIIPFLGVTLVRNPQLWAEASPISYVGPDTPPFLLVHGTADTVVPYQQSVNMLAVLKTAGVDAEIFTAEGAAHGFAGRSPWYTSTTDATAEFFWETLAAEYIRTPAFDNQTRAPRPKETTGYVVETIASGLIQPWSLAFLPDGRALVTERPGRLRLIDHSGRLSEPLSGLPALRNVREKGLHDIVLDPDFADNRTLYLSYYASPPGKPVGAADYEDYRVWAALPRNERDANPFGIESVARAKLAEDDKSLEDIEVIVEGGNRRVVIAPDNTLFVTTSTWGGAEGEVLPQQLDSYIGKVLRINRDGSIPEDNPWIRQNNVHPELYALGFRDIEGAAIHPLTGDLWTVEHGQQGGDEINIIKAGGNFGYPVITYSRRYSGEALGDGLTAKEGMEQPVYFWSPSIAPSGMLFYMGDLFPAWKGNLFVGGLAGKRIARLVLKANRIIGEESLLEELELRIRDIVQGPDGALYVLTAEDDGRLLRLTPSEQNDNVRLHTITHESNDYINE